LENKEQLVEVYRGSGDMQESYGIPCLLRSNAAPSVHLLTMDGMGEVRVMVWESMAEEARRLIVGENHD